MPFTGYLMENEEEALRLDMKTDPEVVRKQAIWAGLKPGMRVADLGCGSGKTSYYLNSLAKPNGETIGVDISEQRYHFAKEHYHDSGLRFFLGDIRDPMSELGLFDFVWIRFVLEYYRANSFAILKNIFELIKPGGIICLIDLDYNCLSHYGIPARLLRTIRSLINSVEQNDNFDPYAGRKLYSYLYDLGCLDIDVFLSAHHLIFGELKQSDKFNFSKKVEAATKKRQCLSEYHGGYEEFSMEFNKAFQSPRRFTYTPVICARGVKPT